MRPDLNRAVAGVGDGHADHRATVVQNDGGRIFQGYNLTRHDTSESGLCGVDVGVATEPFSFALLALLAARLPGAVRSIDGARRRKGARVRDRQEAPVQRQREVAVVRGERVVDGDQLGAVHERALDLHLVQHVRDGGQHVPLAEDATADVHEVGHAEVRPIRPVADELEQHGRDERRRLGQVETHAAREPLLREGPGGVKRELVHLTGGEMHRSAR